MEPKNPEMSHPLKPILKLNNIEVMYQEVILVLKGVWIEVPQGGIVALLGANGAGKSTTLKSISGLLKHEDGQVTDGSIEFSGERIDKLDAEIIAQKGTLPDHRGEKGLPPPLRRRKPESGDSSPKNRCVLETAPGDGLPILPQAPRAAGYSCRFYVWRRAADDGYRPGSDGSAATDATRRTFNGVGSPPHQGNFRHYHPAEPGGKNFHPAGGRERKTGPYRGPLCLCLGKRTPGHARHLRKTERKSRYPLDAAAKAFGQSNRSEPSRSAYSNLGTVYYYLGRLNEAEVMYSKAIELAAEDVQIWFGRADARWYIPQRRELAREDYRRAAALAEKTLAVDATDAETWAILGYIYGRLDDAGRSTRYLQRALEIEADSPFVSYFAAMAAADRGDRKEAGRLASRAIQLGHSRVLVTEDPALKGVPLS